MTNSVTFPTSLGGDGNTYTDDTNASTGLDGGGWRTRFVPALSGSVAMAVSAAASATTAINAPGTNATSTTPLTIGVGDQTLTIQTGKSIVPGMYLRLADTANPTTKVMGGIVKSYDSGTGALVVTVDYTKGSGAASAWTVSLSAPLQSTGWTTIASGSLTGASLDLNSIPPTYSRIRLRWAGASGDAGSGIQLVALISNDNNATRSSNSIGLSSTGWGGAGVFNGQLTIEGYANSTSEARVVDLDATVATTQVNTPSQDIRRLLSHPGGMNAIRLTPTTGNFDAGTYVLEGQ